MGASSPFWSRVGHLGRLAKLRKAISGVLPVGWMGGTQYIITDTFTDVAVQIVNDITELVRRKDPQGSYRTEQKLLGFVLCCHFEH